MNIDFQAVAADAIARTPDWVRADLASKDHVVRERAEEALVARIVDALNAKSGDPALAD